MLAAGGVLAGIMFDCALALGEVSIRLTAAAAQN
jgi:hypothetical protein